MKLIAVRSALVALAATAMALAGAVPANAATPPALPSGSSMYVINCNGNAPTSNQVYSVNSSNADATKLSPNTVSTSACATQPAWDAANNTAYYIRWGDGPTESDDLASINLKTGATTFVAPLHDGATTFNDGLVDAIAIGADGKAYAFAVLGMGDQRLYSVDLSDGSMTEISAVLDPIDSTYYYNSFAYDPVDGDFYAIDFNGNIFRIDVATGAETAVLALSSAAAEDGPTSVNSLQIDSNGVFWFEQDGGDGGSYLYSVTPTDPSTVVQSGLLTSADADGVSRDEFYTEALLIAPTPASTPVRPSLPTTGVDVAGGMFGGAVALLLGMTLLVGVSIRVRLRRSHSTTV